MKKIIIFCIIFVFLPFSLLADQPWYKKWSNFPNAPRIHKEEVKKLIMSGQKVALIYSGYKTNRVICNSFYIPYLAVPPNADGSRVVLPFPKDYWLLCY